MPARLLRRVRGNTDSVFDHLASPCSSDR